MKLEKLKFYFFEPKLQKERMNITDIATGKEEHIQKFCMISAQL